MFGQRWAVVWATQARLGLPSWRGQRQFNTTPGTTSRSPLWSGDNLGGVGLFQITVPAPTHDQVWNWRSNVAAGRTRLEQGRRAARNYPRQIRGSRTLA